MRDVMSPRSKGQRRSRRRGAGRAGLEHRRWMSTWSLLFAAVALVTVAASLFFWQRSREQIKAPSQAAAGLDAPAAKVRVESKFPSPSEEQALALVKQALLNRDPARVGEFVRTGGADPGDVIEFFRTEEKREGPASEFLWLGSVDTDRLLVDAVHVSFKGGGKPFERLALLTPDAKGVWKLDFESYARIVTPSWNDLLEGKAEMGMIRALVVRDDYYNGPFHDDKEWICFSLASPDTDVPFRGYCKVGSPEDQRMADLFLDGSDFCRATLEIRSVPDGEPRQFQIVRVLAKDWVIGDPPGEGG